MLSLFLQRAIITATIAHNGQYRRDGKTPYIVHPLRVGFALLSAGYSDVIVAAAFLHDVKEDVGEEPIKYFVNLFESIPQKEDALIVGRLVDELTKPKNADYFNYIKNLSGFARTIKKADILDNYFDSPTSKQKEKYKKALEIMEEINYEK